MPTTTQEIIDLVSRKLGHPVYSPASNASIGRVLNTSHAHVKRLMAGDSVMSRDAFVRACKFLELPTERVVELTLALDADGSDDEGLGAWMRGLAKNLRGNVVKSSASVLLGAAAFFGHASDAPASEKQALSVQAPSAANFPSMYIMVTRVRCWWRKLRDRFLPPPSPAPLFA